LFDARAARVSGARSSGDEIATGKPAISDWFQQVTDWRRYHRRREKTLRILSTCRAIESRDGPHGDQVKDEHNKHESKHGSNDEKAGGTLLQQPARDPPDRR